jgi:histone-lysine N-methyltransferase SETMAR
MVAEQLNCDKNTAKNDLIFGLGYVKCFRKYVPHDLSISQREERIRQAKEMEKILRSQSSNNFLNVITRDESWFNYRYEQNFVWAPPGTSCSPIRKATIGKEKVMLTVFWSVSGFHVIYPTKWGEALNSELFIKHVLIELAKQFHPDPESNKIYLHMDNSRVHTSAAATEAIGALGFARIPQPPYSPDLAPSDFYLFSRIKAQLKGKEFGTVEGVIGAVKEELEKITVEERLLVMRQWIERLGEVRVRGGDYRTEAK